VARSVRQASAVQPYFIHQQEEVRMNSFTRFAAAGCMALLAACGGGDGDVRPVFTVTYSAGGPPPLEVSYRDANGATVQERVESGQFSRDVVVTEGEPLFVSARTASLTFVTATITANGTLLMAAAARGSATATATCCSPVGAP
jgi:hypothetical protein